MPMRVQMLRALPLPLPPGILDCLEQRALAGGAVLAGVAGEVGLAQFGSPCGKARGGVGMRDARAGPAFLAVSL